MPLRDEERRVVTVLFADLVGFTATAESLDPEDLRSIQSAYFSAVRGAIERYGGTVEKYIGDAVMACFGAPAAHENDPYRAVRAGLDIHAALAGLALPAGGPLQARVGVATGEAVVSLDADLERGQSLIAGDVVNVAARLQDVAPPGGTLVGPLTHRATSGAVDYEEQAPMLLRGKSLPVQVWLARGLIARRHATAEDQHRFVGRGAQLELLTGVLRRAMEERKVQLVTIVGAPGIGKSRIVRELHRHVEALPQLVTWRVGRCLPYGDGVTFWALAEIVKAQSGMLDTDPADLARERLAHAVAGVAGAAEAPWLTERLAPLVGLSAERSGSEESYEAWRRFLLGLAGSGPTVLVLEDLHWAGDDLLGFVDSLVHAAGDVPLLVVCTTRPELLEWRPDWVAGRRHTTTVTLSPLDEQETEEMFAGLLGAALFPTKTQRRLVALAGGNPLYAEEYVRMLSDSGALRRDNGGSSLAPESALPLPDSVHGIIASRLDLLAPQERSLLQAAAVVGDVFWPGAVAATAGRDRGDVELCLRALVRRELIHRQVSSSVGGEDEYAFSHVLVRDIAYGRIPRAHRIEQHRRAADWLDGMAAGRGEDLAELLAHHRVAAYELAVVLGRAPAAYAEPARRALRAAADRAFRLHSVSTARGFVDRSLALWPADVDPAGRYRAMCLAQELCFLHSEDEFYTGSGPERLRIASQHLLELGDLAGAAYAETLLGQVEWYRADRLRAFGHLEGAVALLAAQPESEQKARAYAELARLQMLAHQHDDAVENASIAEVMAESLGLLEVQANAMVTAGAAGYLSGDLAGLRQQEAAVEFCRRHRLRALHRATNNLATALQEEGQLRRSRDFFDESEEAARTGGLSLATRFSDQDLAMRAYFDGDWDRALAVIDTFLAGLDDNTTHPWEIDLRALRGWLRLLRNEPDTGDVERSLELARRGAFPQLLRPVLARATLCRLLSGDAAGAARLYDELDDDWRDDPASASCEWLPAAAVAAIELGGERAAHLRDRLSAVPRQTLWVRAALASLRSAAARQAGESYQAAQLATSAAELYDEIGDVSEHALAALRAGVCWREAGDPQHAERWLERGRRFARRNGAARLLAWLDPDGPAPTGDDAPASGT